MQFLKKVGALTSASAMTGLVVFAGAVGVANAAPVTLVIEPEFLAPGQSAVITVNGCAVGSTLAYTLNGEDLEKDFVVAEGDLPKKDTVAYEDKIFEPGATMEFSVTCSPAEGSAEAESSANDSVTFFGARYVEATPTTFFAGDTVSITAGDFVPGTAVTLEVSPQKSEEVVYSKSLGNAKADFSVTGDVVFPEDLECGEYRVILTGGEYSSVADLYICDKPAQSSPSASPSTSPSTNPTASAQPIATAIPSPTRPANPGLPSTGN